jgi:hypothetical protein
MSELIRQHHLGNKFLIRLFPGRLGLWIANDRFTSRLPGNRKDTQRSLLRLATNNHLMHCSVHINGWNAEPIGLQ